MQNKFHEELSQITKVLLDDTINYSDLLAASKELKSLFFKASEIDTSSEEFKQDIHHKTGKAIGTNWAVLCIDDLLRTKRFIKGAHKAIQTVLKKNNGKPVTLMYVGTGPFATLAMPLTTVFTPEELQLVLVEVNPMSIEALKNCITNFGVEKYIKRIYSSDAAELKVEKPEEIDILLLECLQFALVKEQQVAITYNLVPQLKKEIILLPEEIKLSMCLVDAKSKMNYLLNTNPDAIQVYHKNINVVFNLNKETIESHAALVNSKQLVFPKITTVLTEEDKKNFDSINIATEICVYDDQRLEIDTCSLTMMYKINDLVKIAPMKAIHTQYLVNKNPGLEITYSE